MGLYDRDYTQAEDAPQRYYGTPQFRFGFPSLTPVVKWLLIVNVAIFLAGVIVSPLGRWLETWFALFPPLRSFVTRPWTIVTYEFLHSRIDAWHIFMNMIGLYFLGPALERQWSGRRFLLFYLLCGACGGLLYILLANAGLLIPAVLVGASGSILAILAACAILFPHTTVILFVFPVPIRVAAIGFMAVYVISILTGGGNAGGNAAHLGGMAAGAAYVFLTPRWEKLHLLRRASFSKKNLQRERELQIEVDRILAKVHNTGLHSLSAKEKKTLQKATAEENKRRHY
jgi:membrane associated rhomboid family serine protease